jgi:hypothetical protein
VFQRIPKLNILPQPKNDQEEKTQKSTLHITSQIVPHELASPTHRQVALEGR